MKLRRRPLLVALVAIALCLATSPSLAGAVSTSGPFGGKTAQGFKIRARVAGSHIYLVRVKVRLRCHDGGLLFDDLSDFEASPLEASGNFTDVQFGPSDEVRWTGRLKKDRVQGTLRVTDKVEAGVKCDSGSVHFSATSSS